MKWENLDTRKRWLVVTKSKNGNDIRVPLSLPIVAVLKQARDCNATKSLAYNNADRGKIFPTCTTACKHEKSLKQRGMDLRRTWETVASECGISEEHRGAMTGHAPRRNASTLRAAPRHSGKRRHQAIASPHLKAYR